MLENIWNPLLIYVLYVQCCREHLKKSTNNVYIMLRSQYTKMLFNES